MINANDDSRMVGRIADFVARKYRWPNASSYIAAGRERWRDAARPTPVVHRAL